MKYIFIFLFFFVLNSLKAQHIIQEKFFFEGGLSYNLMHHIFATDIKDNSLINDPIPITFNIDANYTIHKKFAIGFKFIYDTGSEIDNKSTYEGDKTINGKEYNAISLSGLTKNGFGMNFYYSMHKMNMPFSSKVGLHLLTLNINSNVNYIKRTYTPTDNSLITKFELIETEKLDTRVVFLGASYTEQVFFNRKSNLYLIYGINAYMPLEDLPQSITSKTVINHLQTKITSKMLFGCSIGLGYIL